MLTISLVAARRFVLLVEVQGDSMLPTMSDGDRALAVRTGSRLVRKGTVVVARSPGSSDSSSEDPFDDCGRPTTPWVIKRVAALPGDPAPSVTLPYATAPDPHAALAPIPAGHYYLLGDAAACIDSRIWGPLPADQILGPVLIHWRRSLEPSKRPSLQTH